MTDFHDYRILVSADPDRYGYDVTPADMPKLDAWIRERLSFLFPGGALVASDSTNQWRASGPDQEVVHTISLTVHRLEAMAKRSITASSGSR